MALKKSQLYSSLWQSCDELRGGMDASQYKDYVLTLLFVKYVSDKHAGDPNALIDLHDLDAHLNGGIPDRDVDALAVWWDVFPSLRQTLFVDNGRAGYSDARVETHQVKATIQGHDEFTSYEAQVAGILDAWHTAHEARLWSIHGETYPKALIEAMSDDLLRRFADLPLLDPYDIYQCLMDYWEETMQDDVYLVVADGWSDAAQPRGIIEDKQKKI